MSCRLKVPGAIALYSVAHVDWNDLRGDLWLQSNLDKRGNKQYQWHVSSALTSSLLDLILRINKAFVRLKIAKIPKKNSICVQWLLKSVNQK